MSLKTDCFYEFGNFRFDPAEKILLRDGTPVSLTPKVFETLQVLIENAGHLLEKDELMKKIWHDRFVEESNLTFNVKMLRRALNDNAQHPRFIETVPRRGYRFIAEVTEILQDENAANDNAASVSPAPAETTQSRKFYLPIVACGLFLLCVLVIGSWRQMRRFSFNAESSAPILSAPFHSEKLTNVGGVGFAAISPDGKFAAYAAETNGKYSVWLKKLETSENVQIVPPSENFYIGIAFAHDGQTIYFVRKSMNDESQTAAYRVSISGGIPKKILEQLQGWISLSPDDRQISFVRCKYEEADFCSLLVADADGKNERKLLTRPMPVRISDNQFSPDGKSIAFAAGESLNGANDFRLLRFDLTDGKESEISPQNFFEIKSLRWLPGGNQLLLAAREILDGKLNIWQVSAADGKARMLSKDAGNYLNLSLDKRAERMIAMQVSDNFRLYLYSNGETKVLTAAREATFAPDGKIIYTSDDGDIWSMNREGGEQRQLTNSPFKDFSSCVSPDNRFIFFTSTRSGANQVWRMSIDGSDQTQLTRAEGGYPQFVSPDGKWIYYLSGLHQTLWKIAADGGEETQFLEKRVFSPAFAPNGNLLAYYFRDKDKRIKIEVVSVAGKKILKTFAPAGEKTNFSQIVWSMDNRTLNYITVGSSNSLWRQSLDEPAPHFVADLGNQEINTLALAPDNNTFGFVRGEWLSDAVLIDGLK